MDEKYLHGRAVVSEDYRAAAAHDISNAPIHTALRLVDERLGYIETNLSDLEARLTDVVSPALPIKGDVLKQAEKPLSPMHATLDRQANTLDMINGRILRLLERLEL